MNKNKIEKLIGIKNFILDKVEQKTKIINDMEDWGIVCEVRDAIVYGKGWVNSDISEYVENKQIAGNIVINLVNRIKVGLVVKFHESQMKEGRIFLPVSKFFYTNSSICNKKGTYFKVSTDKSKNFIKNWREKAEYYEKLDDVQQRFLDRYLVKTFVYHYSLVLDVVEVTDTSLEIVTLGLSTRQCEVPYSLFCAGENKVKVVYVLYKQPSFLENQQAVSTVVNRMVLNKDILEEGIEYGTMTAKGGHGLRELSEMMSGESNFLEITNNMYIEQGMFFEVQDVANFMDKWKID